MEFRFFVLGTLFLISGPGCTKDGNSDDLGVAQDLAGTDDLAGADLAMPPLPSGVGQVAYRLVRNNHVYRVAASSPPETEDVTTTLDAFSAGSDSALSLAPDGTLAALVTTRFGCDFDCLVLAPIANGMVQGASAARALANGNMVHPQDRVALATGGSVVVYTAGGGPHMRDQYVIKRNPDGSYGAPKLLTAASTFAFNLLPSLSPDAQTVVFDCSASGGASGVSLCRVGLDGSGFAVAVAPTSYSGGTSSNEVHSGNLDPSGALVFEADWTAERVWRRTAAGSMAVVGNFENDNTPCLLPDGRIASLWLNRPGSTGVHELKLMPADGSSYQMLLQGDDVLDVGLSCSE